MTSTSKLYVRRDCLNSKIIETTLSYLGFTFQRVETTTDRDIEFSVYGETPILQAGDKCIEDTRLIFRYLLNQPSQTERIDPIQRTELLEGFDHLQEALVGPFNRLHTRPSSPISLIASLLGRGAARRAEVERTGLITAAEEFQKLSTTQPYSHPLLQAAAIEILAAIDTIR
jgi:hypothetical protein